VKDACRYGRYIGYDRYGGSVERADASHLSS
jgi:hypothetical protein